MSCADVQTIQPGNGSKTQFSFDFPYIFKSEIQVSFWNATTKEWDVIAQIDAAYPWQVTDANPTIVEFTGNAPPAPSIPVDPNETAVDNVRIRRVTNIDDIRALFNPGSAIRSDDLNKNFEQLRYAIQESNCQGITEDVYQYLLNNYWDRFDNTIYSGDTWVSDDTKIATTKSIDQRIDNKIDDALTLDINGSDGITVTDNTPSGGQIVVGIGVGSVDLDRIKDEDILTYAEEVSGSPSWNSDGRVPTTYAAARRFDTLVQATTPIGSAWPVGKTWLQNDPDKTLSVWDGSNWEGVASGGTFTNQPKVVYVDASSGDDANDGHRISRPKLTIKAAIEQINGDATYGDGSIVVVAPGVYQEVAPIDILKVNVSIVGAGLRSCIIHPTSATERNVLFRVNSGTFLQNLTFMGVKASGSAGNAVDPELPINQGWNVAFYPGVTIRKSPYIQNCTNFSDSGIDNDNINVINPGGGSGGDLTSSPTGGGILIDGSVVANDSPLRSMVTDSYTQVGLNGPGILVTNNGYTQCTSSYAFFNTYHIKCLNGGQANLAASTTDFGNRGLVADGKSTFAIFTAPLSTNANDGDITFTINTPTANPAWHGSATRPQGNMLVILNGITYPILSATPNGTGWDVTISRPDPNNRSNNLGLDGAVTIPATASFYLRSLIASSGHTMEYVGSGTDYRALPENGGVPDDTKQITELNGGKVWAATTDQNGKFKLGGNQTDDPFFEVDQQRGFVTIPEGSIAFNLLSDRTPQLGGDLDANGFDVVLAPGSASGPSLTFDGDTNSGIYSPGADQVAVATNGTGRLFVDASGNVDIASSSQALTLLNLNASTTGNAAIRFNDTTSNIGNINYNFTDDALTFRVNGSERLRITSAGLVGIGTSSPSSIVDIKLNNTSTTIGGSTSVVRVNNGSGQLGSTSGLEFFHGNDTSTNVTRLAGVYGRYASFNGSGLGGELIFATNTPGDATIDERMRIDSSGRVGIGTTSPGGTLHSSKGGTLPAVNGTEVGIFQWNVVSGNTSSVAIVGGSGASSELFFGDGDDIDVGFIRYEHPSNALAFATDTQERARIDSSGRLLVGTSTSRVAYGGNVTTLLQIEDDNRNGLSITTNEATIGNRPAIISLIRTRSASLGGNTIVNSGDVLGSISFEGTDGTGSRLAAVIDAEVDGTPGANDMPGRIVLRTSAAGSSTPMERMRIKASGIINFSNVPVYADNTAALAGGLVAGDVYRKSDGTLMITF